MNQASTAAAALITRRLLLLDIGLLLLTVYLVFVLRLEAFDPGEYRAGFAAALLIYPPLLIVALLRSGAYRHYWPFASLRELRTLVAAVLFGSAAAAVFLLLLGWWQPAFALPYSFSVLVVPFALAAVAAPRLGLRLLQQRRTAASQRGEPVLVIGAGAAGALAVRELQTNPRLGLRPVGLIDDDPARHGKLLGGVPVLGGSDILAEASERYGVSRAVIALSSAAGPQIRALYEACRAAGLQTQIVPDMLELLSGRAGVGRLRPLAITDLLRRAPVQTDTAAVARMLHNRTVLVSGGGGSIGSELCRQLLTLGPSRLLLLGHGENSVFEAEAELRRLSAGHPNAPQIIALIADVREAARLRRLFLHYRPDTVFHTAAHKHVPLMEAHPAEAVLTNVFGTANLLAAAQAVNVERFVLISTDKAVNPTSVMGVTKRVAELLVLDAALHLHRSYVTVRFGNVLGSRGSVVQTFQRQIAQGGPLTITDPAMTRYFMTIPEAVQLVLQAAQLGRPGDLFMLDMGRPVRILDLAQDMIRLSGLQEGRDIAINVSGRRPGEKLHEELLRPDEDYLPSPHPAISLARRAATVPAGLHTGLIRLRTALADGDDHQLLVALQQIVPEFQPEALQRENAHAERPAPDCLDADLGRGDRAAAAPAADANRRPDADLYPDHAVRPARR